MTCNADRDNYDNYDNYITYCHHVVMCSSNLSSYLPIIPDDIIVTPRDQNQHSMIQFHYMSQYCLYS